MLNFSIIVFSIFVFSISIKFIAQMTRDIYSISAKLKFLLIISKIFAKVVVKCVIQHIEQFKSAILGAFEGRVILKCSFAFL